MTKRARKNSKPVHKATIKTRSVLISIAIIIPLTIGFSAIARNVFFPKPTIKIHSGKFDGQASKHPNFKTVKQFADAPEEPLPSKAKQATVAEAKQLMAQVDSTNSAFTYDPYGRLAKIVEPDGSIRQFIYIGDKMREERDGSGTVTKRFFDWGEEINGSKYFYIRDHLGSVRELTDISGNVVAEYSYDPFGRGTKISGTGPDSDFLFGGYFYHKASGLYITTHRFYSPKLGRWLSRDPIGDKEFRKMQATNPEESDPGDMVLASAMGRLPDQNMLAMQIANNPARATDIIRIRHAPDLNAYTYVNNNPVKWTDPSGLAVGSLPLPIPRPQPKPSRNPIHPPPPGEPGAPEDLYSCYDWCAAHNMTYEDYMDCCAWCDEHYCPDPE